MIPAAIIACALVAVWLYLSHMLRLPKCMVGGVEPTGYSLDINGRQYSFLYFYDRYRSILRDICWLTVIGIAAAAEQRNHVALMLLLISLASNVFFQGLMLLWYEAFAHAHYTRQGVYRRFSYTARKYALVLTMLVAVLAYVLVGAAMLAMRFMGNA